MKLLLIAVTTIFLLTGCGDSKEQYKNLSVNAMVSKTNIPSASEDINHLHLINVSDDDVYLTDIIVNDGKCSNGNKTNFTSLEPKGYRLLNYYDCDIEKVEIEDDNGSWIFYPKKDEWVRGDVINEDE